MSSEYSIEQPLRSAIDALTSPAVLEFGTAWCGYCQAAQPLIASALSGRTRVRHIKVEDGQGRPLGRSFHVKLWPTLIFLSDGKEVARVVRPANAQVIADALRMLEK